MINIKNSIKKDPALYRLLQYFRNQPFYPNRRPALLAFDHDSLTARFKISVLSKSKYFHEYASALRDALSENGVEVNLCSSISEDDNSHAILVIGGHTVARSELRDLQHKYVLSVIQTEQICSFSQGSYRYAAHQLKKLKLYADSVDIIFEWHRENAKALADLNPSIHYVPHGGLPKKDLVRSNDFEIVFLGNRDAVLGRRSKILQELARKFRVYPKSSDTWGDYKDHAFSSSKIVLNLHAETSQVFESPRFYEATSYGRLIVSEPIFDSHPFEPGVHFVEAQLNEFVDVLDFYLRNDDKRRDLERASQKLTEEHTIKESAREMRDIIMLRHYLLTS